MKRKESNYILDYAITGALLSAVMVAMSLIIFAPLL